MRAVLHSTKSAEGKKWCACRIKGTRENQKPTLALQSALWQQPEIEREKLSCRFNCLCALLINLTWFDVCYHLIRHFESFTSLCSVATRIHIHSLDGLTLYRTVSSESVHTHICQLVYFIRSLRGESGREKEKESSMKWQLSRFQMQFN